MTGGRIPLSPPLVALRSGAEVVVETWSGAARLTHTCCLQEVLAAQSIAQRGVMLVATTHGPSLKALLRNHTLNPLLGGIEMRKGPTHVCVMAVVFGFASPCRQYCSRLVHMRMRRRWSLSEMLRRARATAAVRRGWSARTCPPSRRWWRSSREAGAWGDCLARKRGRA